MFLKRLWTANRSCQSTTTNMKIIDIQKQKISFGVLIKIFANYSSINNELKIYAKDNCINMIIQFGQHGGLLSFDAKTQTIISVTPIWEKIIKEVMRKV